MKFFGNKQTPPNTSISAENSNQGGDLMSLWSPVTRPDYIDDILEADAATKKPLPAIPPIVPAEIPVISLNRIGTNDSRYPSALRPIRSKTPRAEKDSVVQRGSRYVGGAALAAVLLLVPSSEAEPFAEPSTTSVDQPSFIDAISDEISSNASFSLTDNP